MVEKQNINIPLIATIGAISCVLLIVIGFGLQAWFHAEVEDEHSIKITGIVDWRLADHELSQQEKLQTYRLIDSQKQTAAIPIDEAIRLTVKKYEGR